MKGISLKRALGLPGAKGPRPFATRRKKKPAPPSRESLAGKWVAYASADGPIVATADTYGALRRKARRAGHDDFVVERIPSNVQYPVAPAR
jgi:hypothetical protein